MGEREGRGGRERGRFGEREEALMMGVKRSAKKRRIVRPFVCRVFRSKVPLYPAERREASAVPWQGPTW